MAILHIAVPEEARQFEAQVRAGLNCPDEILLADLTPGLSVHGGAGMCQDFPLAYFYTLARTLRFADGPDEVHRNAIAKIELGKLTPRA
jgi:alkylation response protein AidB-like acyl-CoA dehydrogenase